MGATDAEIEALLSGVTCAGIDADDDSHGARLRRLLLSLREQVRALTAERDGFKRTAAMVSEAGDRLTVTTAALEAERDALRARVAEVEAERDAYRDSLVETAHFYMEWALKDGNSPGYNIAKARTYGDKANEYRIRAEKAESERDSAQQRAKALTFCLHKMMGHMGVHAWNCALCNEARELTKEEAP